MTNILEEMAKTQKGFTPSNTTEYLALQIARKLSDIGAVQHYAVLFDREEQNKLLDIFRRCAKENRLSGEYFMNILKKQ